jgi:HEPN domain-containing protein
MNRSDFQKLAEVRLKDAQVLLEKGCYSGAYYLAGYVVECGLKACIAKQTKKFDFPPNRKAIDAIYTHNLKELIKSAGLDVTFNKDLKKDKKLDSYWAVLKDWTEESRYEKYNQRKAQDIYQAIADKKHGVLQWISQRW